MVAWPPSSFDRRFSVRFLTPWSSAIWKGNQPYRGLLLFTLDIQSKYLLKGVWMVSGQMINNISPTNLGFPEKSPETSPLLCNHHLGIPKLVVRSPDGMVFKGYQLGWMDGFAVLSPGLAPGHSSKSCRRSSTRSWCKERKHALEVLCHLLWRWIHPSRKEGPWDSYSYTSWWLNQPIWKICSSNLDHFPK